MNVKIKDGFVLREVSGVIYVVAVGRLSRDFKAIISINEVGAFIFKNIKEGLSLEDVAKKLNEEYDLPGETEEEKLNKALLDINNLVSKMREAGMLENE